MSEASLPEIDLLEQTNAMILGGQRDAQPLGIAPDLARMVAEGGKDNVLSALQTAIELEHSTIPPYLYAFYSLKSSNSAIAGLIRSVVIEEMLHMALACNILNALGGSPVIDKPGFLPVYPSTLPGIQPPPGWEVDLAPFSKELVSKIFMQIEMPEKPIPISLGRSADEGPALPTTIGQFYQLLGAQIQALGDGAFVSPPRNQITTLGAIAVHNVATALQAITVIIDQGEGTDTDPFDESGEPAHYYRFGEIVAGKALVRQPDGRYAYAGDPIPFDPSGVWNVYPDRRVQHPDDVAFNTLYTTLLKNLHDGFNGDSSKINVAIGEMFTLTTQATQMMSTQPYGPSFQYHPADPSS